MEEQQSLASSTGADEAEKLQAEQEPAEIKPKKRDIHSDMQHEPCCFTCGKEDDDLIPCSFCPKTFHAACLPVGTKITAPRWGCPSHKCMVCGAATSKSRGKIYRCAYCPSAYCFTHLPVDSRVFATNPLEKYGYHTTSFFFINCPPCLERRRTQTKQEPGLLEPTEGSKADADEGELLILIRKRKRSNRASTGSEEGSGGSDPPPPPVKKPKSERNEVDPLTPNVELIYSLKRLMHINKVSQKQVSKDLRVSESTLSAFMNEKSRISGWVEFEDRVRKWLAANGDHVLEYELDKKREQVDTNRLKLESQFYSSSHFANIHPEVQQQLVSSFTPTNAGNNYSQPHLQPYRVNMQNGFTADEHYSHNHNHNHNHNHSHNESMHANHAPTMSAQHSNSAGMPPNHNMHPSYYHSFIPPQHQFSNMHGNFSHMYPVPHMPTPLHLVPTPSYPPQFFDPIAQGLNQSHSPNGFKNDSNNNPTTGSSSLTILSHMNNLAPPSSYPTNTSNNAQKGNFVAHTNNMQQSSPLTTMIAQSINNANHSMNNNPASAPNQNQFPFNIQPTLDKRNGQSFGMSPSPFTPTAPGLGSNLSSYSSVTSNTGQQMTAGSNFDRQLPPVPRMLDPLLNRTGPAFMPPHPRPSEIWK